MTPIPSRTNVGIVDSNHSPNPPSEDPITCSEQRFNPMAVGKQIEFFQIKVPHMKYHGIQITTPKKVTTTLEIRGDNNQALLKNNGGW